MSKDNLYEGKPDSRQEGEIKVSRFRPKYRSLKPEEVALHNEIKAKAEELEQLIEQVGAGRYQSLAFTSLEEAVMWSVKQLTS